MVKELGSGASARRGTHQRAANLAARRRPLSAGTESPSHGRPAKLALYTGQMNSHWLPWRIGEQHAPAVDSRVRERLEGGAVGRRARCVGAGRRGVASAPRAGAGGAEPAGVLLHARFLVGRSLRARTL